MIVYRVEHRDSKKGPWSHDDWHVARAGFVSKEYWHGSLPGPYADPSLGRLFKNRHLCGVESVEKLVRWFPSKVRRQMHERGFVMRVFDVETRALAVGRWQVTFPRKRATLLGELPLRGMAGIRNGQFSHQLTRGKMQL